MMHASTDAALFRERPFPRCEAAMLRDLSLSALLLATLLTATLHAQAPTGESLPDTAPLTIEEPLDVVMVRGISQFAEHLLATAPARRGQYWNRDYSSVEAYQASVEPNRERLKKYLGMVDQPTPPRLLLDASSGGWQPVTPVQWDVLEGVSAEGYLIHPYKLDEGAEYPDEIKAAVVAIPDATQTPESISGLDAALPPEVQWARRLAENGCLVLVVAPINRESALSGHPDIRYTNFSHREYVYRCAFELGRHVIGYELQRICQGRRLLEEIAGDDRGIRPPLGIAGVGEGGLLALYAAAIEPEFDAALVSGYFQQREGLWQEPIDRNVWRRVSEFGDSDLASLIAPRPLVIDSSNPPAIAGPNAAIEGRAAIAAPGTIGPLDVESVMREFERAKSHYASLDFASRINLVQPEGADSGADLEAVLRTFLAELGISEVRPPIGVAFPEADTPRIDSARQQRLVGDLVRHTQMILHRSDKVRDKFWAAADRSSVETWEKSSQVYRDYVHDELIGRLPLPNAPLNPRTRRVIDEPTHVGYEVMLDVYTSGESRAESQEPTTSDDQTTANQALDTRLSALDSCPPVIAGGILLLPKDLKPGERRPVVVCQHGLEGMPMDTITTDPAASGYPPYKGFSTELVKRGFIVYAPQNPYRGYHDFRVIQRKSNPLGLSLFSYIIEQHRQTLRWLGTLPYVDPERIAFYGLSYGGKTAVRVPPLLLASAEPSAVSGQPSAEPSDATPLTPHPTPHNHPGYCLSICSADFNEWIRKNCSAEDRYSYVYTMEYEIWEWNMGHIADYAELSSLMAPRPFMVERGHDDGVAPDEWVGWEFAKVRRHYDKLGIGDRTEIEWFNGPHTINGQGTFRFLHKHLNWPEP
jgi:hypothetical protein